METLKTFFAIPGIVYFIYLIIGLVIDVTTFDQTKGGYEPPYEGWTGTQLIGIPLIRPIQDL